jgi:alpha-N-acetylglucosamine transferase
MLMLLGIMLELLVTSEANIHAQQPDFSCIFACCVPLFHPAKEHIEKLRWVGGKEEKKKGFPS